MTNGEPLNGWHVQKIAATDPTYLAATKDPNETAATTMIHGPSLHPSITPEVNMGDTDTTEDSDTSSMHNSSMQTLSSHQNDVEGNKMTNAADARASRSAAPGGNTQERPANFDGDYWQVTSLDGSRLRKFQTITETRNFIKCKGVSTFYNAVHDHTPLHGWYVEKIFSQTSSRKSGRPSTRPVFSLVL